MAVQEMGKIRTSRYLSPSRIPELRDCRRNRMFAIVRLMTGKSAHRTVFELRHAVQSLATSATSGKSAHPSIVELGTPRNQAVAARMMLS